MESKKLYPKVRQFSQEKVSLISVMDHERNTLNIIVADKGKVSKVKIKLNNINVLDKINFHKQTNEIMYNDLLQFTVNTKKLETKVVQLEGHLKQERETNRGWQVEIKKLEVFLVCVG